MERIAHQSKFGSSFEERGLHAFDPLILGLVINNMPHVGQLVRELGVQCEEVRVGGKEAWDISIFPQIP